MPSRRALLVGLGAATVPLAGCNYLLGDDGDDGAARQVPGDWSPAPGEWGGPGYDQANSGHNHHASPPKSEPTVDWTVDAGRGSVLVADGTVFLRTSGTLRGLDAEDGTEQFSVQRLSGGLRRYVDGRLYDAGIDGVEALMLGGTAAWDDPFDYDDPVVGLVERDGYVYASNGTDTIHHHHADTGERVDSTVHDATVRGLANRDGVLYAALADGVVAYDVADDGSLDELWRHDLGGGDEPEPRTVAVRDGRACVVQRRGQSSGPSAVTTVDAESEERLATVEFEDNASVAALGGYTYVTTNPATGRLPSEGALHAYDGDEEVWTVELAGASTFSVLADGTLYVGSGFEELFLTAVDATSGDELWTYEGAFPHAVVGETVYATTSNGRFVALRAD